jgi:hypothetical protein
MAEWISYQDGATYVGYKDGTVVAYGYEREPSRPGLMIASGWSAHPLVDENARHLGHLCVDAEPAEFRAAMTAWAEEHGGVAVG